MRLSLKQQFHLPPTGKYLGHPSHIIIYLSEGRTKSSITSYSGVERKLLCNCFSVAHHSNSFSYFIKYMHRLNVNITYKLRCFDSGMFFVGLGSFFCCLRGRVLDEPGRSFLLLRLLLKFLVLSLFYIYCKHIH